LAAADATHVRTTTFPLCFACIMHLMADDTAPSWCTACGNTPTSSPLAALHARAHNILDVMRRGLKSSATKL
jgi:hypothetical protein